MHKKTKVSLGAAAVVVAALTVGTAYSASADPAAGSYTTLSGVGSDTIQDVMNGLSSSVGTQSGNSTLLGSYDAVNPATQQAGGSIQTSASGNAFPRPNGSSAGIEALEASYGGGNYANNLYQTVNIAGQVQYARSSSGPSAAGTDLTYIPFAQDAVTYAVNEASDFPRDIALGSSADTTSFTLYNIYHCNATSYTNSKGKKVTITPLLPQSGSGTRKFWEATMGLTDSSLPSCVTSLNNTVEENSGKELTDPGYIMPFSVAQYISQGNHSLLPSNVTERRYGAQLGKIDDIAPYVISGSGTTATIVQNPSFEVSRLVYNVVVTNSITSGNPAYNQNLVNTLVGSSSYVCSATSQALVQQYGFSSISNCGATSITGPFIS